MLRLFVPPSIRRFVPRHVPPGASTRHRALEYDLVEALRPSLVVDLGAGDGVSFFTYCQSMRDHDVDGVCYAIDAFAGSAPEAELGFEALNRHGRTHYPGLCYVVDMPPHEARRHFKEESIDLLRIDAARPGVIAGADVEAWFRRVRPGGVIAWYGAGAEPKLWSLVASRSASVVFGVGPGIGLARKPGAAAGSELVRLLFEENEGPELERFYAHVDDHVEFERLLALAGKQTK